MRGRGIDTPRLQKFLPPFDRKSYFRWTFYAGQAKTVSAILTCLKKLIASSGNRTRAARVAGEHSTTEPTMLSCCLQAIYFSLFISGIYLDILFAGLISRRYLLDFHFGVRCSFTSFTFPFNRRELINYFSSSIL